LEDLALSRKGIAEFLGSYALTFAVTGAITTGVATGGVQLIVVALAAGLMLAIMVSAFGHISGGHFNPAVTFGFLVTRRVDGTTAAVYWGFQFLGGILAALTVRALYDARIVFPGGEEVDLKVSAAPVLGPFVSVGEAFLAELVLTFFLVLVVFATAVDKEGAFRVVAGFAIGLTIAVDILVGGPISGAFMNPQVALGAAVAAWEWNHGTWIYYVACPIGGAIAAVLYDRVFIRPQEGRYYETPAGEEAV
jgi:aquaporin Z